MRLKHFLSVFLTLLTLSVGQMWGAIQGELAICQGTGSGYGTRRTLTDSHSVSWVLASGQSGYLGANSATNHDKVKPTAADLPVVKAVKSDATTSTTGYYFYYTSTAVSNVGAIEFSYTGNSGNSTATAYVVSCGTAAEANSTTWSTITLASNSATAQGASLGTSGTFTYTFAATETSAKYYGIIIVASSYKRMTAGTIKLQEGCTAPTAVAKGTVTSSSFGLNITDAQNTNNYDIYFSTNNSAPNASTSATTTTTSKTPTISSGVSENTTYYVWVRSSKNITISSKTTTWKSAWRALTGNTLTTPAGALCTNEITIAKGTPSNGSFTMTPDGGTSVCIADEKASVTISNINPSNGYRFKEITSSGGGTIDNNAKTVTNISASTTINVVFEQIPSHKAYFYNGATLLNTGGTSFQEGAAVSYGGSSPVSCDTGEGASTTFAGWATAEWSGKVAKNAIVPAFYEGTLPVMGEEDVTYYAVFCKSGEIGDPINKFSVNLQVANNSISWPTGYSYSNATEWKNSNRQDGGNDLAKVYIYHASTKLFSVIPSIITVKAELAGGSARDPLNNSVYAVFLDNEGNEIDGSATILCTGVTGEYVEKSVNMPIAKATNAYGIGIRHTKESSYNVRYKSLTLSYTTATEGTEYMTTCCTSLGSINGSFFWTTHFCPVWPAKHRS